MNQVSLINATRKNQAGATMIEYCFIALLILVVAVAAVGTVGVETKNNFEKPELIAAFS